MNPILEKHRGVQEYDLFGLPEIHKSYILDSDKPNMGADDWFWAVSADYAPDNRCSFDGKCNCKEWISRGFDTEEEAAVFAAVIKAGARRIR